MSGFESLGLICRLSVAVACGAVALQAQSCLVLSQPIDKADGTTTLEVSLYSPTGTRPVAIQWTMQAPAGNVSTVAMEDGPILAAAGKTVICSGEAGSYQCLATGANMKAIGNGLIAKLVAVPTPGSGALRIQISNPMAVSADGYQLPIDFKVKATAGADLSRECRPRPPAPGTAAAR